MRPHRDWAICLAVACGRAINPFASGQHGVIRGYAALAPKADAVPLTGDNLRHEAAWKTATPGGLPSAEVMIRIHLENAEVFAITLL